MSTHSTLTTSRAMETESQTGMDTILIKKAISYTPIKSLKGHKFGVERIIFAPQNQFLITLGDANDRGMFVWDWLNETKISQNKLSKPVNAIAFSEEQDFFVTAGY